MIDAATKALFHSLARSRSLKRLASQYGMASPDSFARRFIAGETVEEAIAAARAIQAQGFLLTLDYLGESVSTLDEADAATREYLRILDVIVASNVERNISLKLTQLGLDVDRATCVDNLRRILTPAARHGFFVRIDMESSPYTEVTLDVFQTLWQQDYRNVGVVLQSCLYRSEADARRVTELGARIRLVKGAYKEPKTVAWQQKAEVDAAYVRLTEFLLDHGVYPAIATHDAEIIETTIASARARGIAADRFEFQMLYGVRRDLQRAIVDRGYRMRVYVPFGREWFPYFMRRLGERPANVGFVLKSLMRESYRPAAH
jgi:proline dehydrogenase